MKYAGIPVILLLLMLSACNGGGVTVEFQEMQEDIARFDLHNNTDRAVRSVMLELTYFSEDGSMLLADTTTYSMAQDDNGDEQAFLEAQGETFIGQQSPPQTVSADARVLAETYMDESS